MRITQEKLKEILASHSKWLEDEYDGGRKANLSNVDLSCINLCHTDLRGANLCGANLCNANLYGANLCGADLSNSSFDNANLSTTSLSKTYYQIVRIGSREATTTYCVDDDNVRCGCWNNYEGGTLAEFKERVESVYGEEGKTPNKKYYTQYMAARYLEYRINNLCPKGRERKIALQRLEEVVMWVNKAIAYDGADK